MSSLRLNPMLSCIPIFSIRLIENYRVFDLIQQNVQNPKASLTLENFENFTQRFYACKQLSKISKIMQQLNKEGQQLKNQKFAINLAKCTKQLQFTSDQSLIQYYKQIRNFFNSNYQKPLQKFELLDDDENISPEMLEKKFKNIVEFESALKPYINGMQIYAFQTSLEQINYCLSIASMQVPQDSKRFVYQTFLNPTVMQHISEFLKSLVPYLIKNQSQTQIISNSQNVLRYFKCVSYLYTMCKHSQQRIKLENSSCLFFLETYSIIIHSLNIAQNRIRKQVAICLAFLSKNSQNFNNWILSDPLEQNLQPLLQNIGSLNEEQGLYYALILLKNIIIHYQKKSQSLHRKPQYQSKMQTILKFSCAVLQYASLIQTQKQAILLISELLKVCPIGFAQIQQLKITNKVFQTEILIQNSLVPATLRILETSILKSNEELTNSIINDNSFLYCIENSLGIKGSMFYHQFLHIVYLLSFEHIDYLIQKGILNKLVNLMFDNHSHSVVSIGSDILLNAIQQAIQKDKILEVLYQKLELFNKIIPFLFMKCFQKNQCTDIFMSKINQNNQVFAPEYNYFDKCMLINIFKMLYCLAVGISRRHKRFSFSKKLDKKIIASVANILQDLFKSQNRALIEIILREKIKIQNNRKIKLDNGVHLYKIINIILEQMTYNMENRQLDELKIINQQKRSYCNNLLKSSIFQIHELEVQGISIYLSIQFNFDGDPIRRFIPHKFQLSSLKNYLKLFICKAKQLKESQIRDIVIKHIPSNRIVQNEVQYRSLVNKTIENKETQLKFDIVDLKIKGRREDLGGSFMGQVGQRSIRGQNSFAGRQAVSRITQNSRHATLRQHSSHHDPRKSYYSPNHLTYSYRDNSPAFGGRNT